MFAINHGDTDPGHATARIPAAGQRIAILPSPFRAAGVLPRSGMRVYGYCCPAVGGFAVTAGEIYIDADTQAICHRFSYARVSSRYYASRAIAFIIATGQSCTVQHPRLAGDMRYIAEIYPERYPARLLIKAQLGAFRSKRHC